MNNTNPYKPISCEYYDVILSFITLKKEVELIYWTDNQTRTLQTKIVDIYTKNKMEFILTFDQKTIRLDQIISIDDQNLADFGQCKI